MKGEWTSRGNRELDQKSCYESRATPDRLLRAALEIVRQICIVELAGLQKSIQDVQKIWTVLRHGSCAPEAAFSTFK